MDAELERKKGRKEKMGYFSECGVTQFLKKTEKEKAGEKDRIVKKQTNKK